MSKIHRLIEEICPSEVKYNKLSDFTHISDGFAFKKEMFNLGGKYPIIRIGNLDDKTDTQGDYFISEFPENFKTTALINGGEILVAMSGATAGKTAYNDIQAVVNQRIAIIRARHELINRGFLKHLLLNNLFYDYCQKLGTSDQKNISKKDIGNYLIPGPSLVVQNELVRILDNFTELETELEAELEATTKQYEYYRNKLLDFSTGSVGVPRIDKMLAEMYSEGVQKKTLIEIGVILGGMSGKSKDDFTNGNSKYITYMNVYKNPQTILEVNDFVMIRENEKQHQIQKGDVLFTGSSETPDECGISSVVCDTVIEPIYLNSFCFIYRPKKELFNPHFLKHLFRSFELRKQIGNTANGVTRYNVSKKLFYKVEIPIPPLEIQDEIVKILDTFSEYVTSISQGLPAEIAARRKQYEYYRNKLLTF
jgi:type I restriction enzyme S subunit